MENRSVFSGRIEAASIVFAALLGLLSSAEMRAQDAPNNQCEENQNPPGDASLHVLLKDGRSAFHEGEIIPLAAEYSADTANKYVLNNRNYDRSGRLSGAEVFCIDPSRGSDPLDDYFHSLQAMMGGGIFSEQDPNRNPLTMNLELNEWVSLPPGSYRLTVIGNRLSLGKEGDAATWQNKIIPLRSNSIEFQVEPADPDWQASQLASATQVLDSSVAGDEEKKHAARVLRFLGSEGSTREIARRYGTVNDPFEWEFKFGLFASSHRELAIQAMKAELTDPDHPVTHEYISTLVTLEMLSDPKLRLPTYDPNHQEEWRRANEAYNAEFERRENAYWQQASNLPRERGALAATASEVLQSGLPLRPEVKTRWRQALISQWSTLPVEKQNELIDYRWTEVGGSEWLPILEQIVAGPATPGHALNKPNRESALLRILQIAPEDARPLILQEIAKPPGDIGISVLGLLPDRVLPQFESAWLEEIRRGGVHDIEFQLVDRYGSEHALPALQTIYEAQRGEWACVSQTAMLRYFLRVKPDYGLNELTAAMALRKTTGCYREQLSELHEYARMPQVQELAIQRLDDPAPSVASDAARVLQQYGSPQAEKALWARLEKFHEQWKDKPDELLHPSRKPDVFESEIGLEQCLVQAIEGGQAWFADAAVVEHLRDLSSPSEQDTLARGLDLLAENETSMDMSWWPDDELHYTIGWYTGKGMANFKEKLAQFPPRTHFRLVTTKATEEAHQADFEEAQRAASVNGETIEIVTPR